MREYVRGGEDYAGSASSPGRKEPDTDGFVFLINDDTEVERRRRRERDSDSKREVKKIPPDVAAHPLVARVTLLPWVVGGGRGFKLNRKRCEDALLLVAVCVAIAQLGYGWNEWALAAGE